MNSLHWLPQHPDIRQAIRELSDIQLPADQLSYLRWLSGHQLDFNQIVRIDKRLQALKTKEAAIATSLPQVKLAVLASSTVEHLQAAIRVAALRRGLLADIYVAPYGQYRQAILNPASQLYQFGPDAVLLSLDNSAIGLPLSLEASRLEVEEAVSQRVAEWEQLWQVITTQLGSAVIQQTFVPSAERLFGNYDTLVPASPVNVLHQVNAQLRQRAAEHRTLLLDVADLAAEVSYQSWADPTLWHHAKQAVSPVYAPLYGEQVSRILAALRGLSSKCLVLDLDNTLWGGVIGDDGLSGIELGQGTGPGEAFQAFQHYVKSLKQRGIILAVCSKNNDATAREPFEKHPEMVLKLEDFAAFVANWEDKATNLKRIAAQLNIGLDSLVFFDDNPAERAIVRQFADTVAVPEVPEDPAWYRRCLSDAGYFEAVSFSKDDAQRADQYRANSQRQALMQEAHSIDSFLESLKMQLTVAPVDAVSLQRATQLVNRSNQFNLTTHRYTEAQMQQMSDDPDILCLQMRLQDAFGDNGLISVIIAKPAQLDNQKGLHVDTWLMSCRVLGRQVEQAVLNVLVEQSQQRGEQFLLGEYVQTKKNEMVKQHYANLGFSLLSEKLGAENEFRSLWHLDLETYKPFNTFIQSSFCQ
ncbi:HAD-IIIC family phosphatase [Sphaerothrix gracilis]|uniref:HAD-IIIC family phosphatase n=1 Tax=Sphaerothrix gracilis TaxID=3151835 RepID=UPI0031FC0AD2